VHQIGFIIRKKKREGKGTIMIKISFFYLLTFENVYQIGIDSTRNERGRVLL